jgi:hypothetical protein
MPKARAASAIDASAVIWAARSESCRCVWTAAAARAWVTAEAAGLAPARQLAGAVEGSVAFSRP